MPPVITTLIGAQSYEQIRDRIAAVLLTELVNQTTLTATGLPAKVWVERFVSPDKAELPLVNVSLAKGDYESNTVLQSDGSYTFFIDCYTRAKTTSTKNGDTEAMFALQKLIGVCRAILRHSSYKTLGYEPGFISAVRVNGFLTTLPTADAEANSIAWGRLIVQVMAPETEGTTAPGSLTFSETTIRLNNTERGYFFSTANT